MADGTRRTFAQGSKGGWYVVGSERVENGKTKRDYVPESVAMRAMQGKATDAEIDAAITTRPSGKKTRTKQDGTAPTQPRQKKQDQPTSSNLPVGRTPKQRDPRLPARGTVIKSRDGKVYVREDSQGTFHLYDAKNNSELATGKTLTSVMVKYTGKPVNAYGLLGLQRSKKKAQEKREAAITPKSEPDVAAIKVDKKKKNKPADKKNKEPKRPAQPKTRTKRPRRERKPGETKPRRRKSSRPQKPQGFDKREEGKGKGAAAMSPKQVSYAEHLAYKHFQRKLRNNFRRAAESTIGLDKSGWTKLRLDMPDGKQFVVKTSPDRKQTWAKEKSPTAKPFKVTDAWVQQMQNVRASKPGKLPDANNNRNQTISVKNTVKKAFTLAEQEYDVGACEVYLDGIVMRGLTGGITGFVPIAASANGNNADEIVKAVAEATTTKEVRVSLEPVPRIPATEDSVSCWTVDGEFYKSLQHPANIPETKPSTPDCFMYNRNANAFVGCDTIDDLCVAIGSIHTDAVEKAVEDKPAPRKGYPKKQSDYADKEQYKYPIETESHVKAALSYFGNPDNRKAYSESQQREIARRILSAAKRFGIDVDDQSEVGKLARPVAKQG